MQIRTGAQILENLDPEQREVALNLRGPVKVLAGAGTGKTRAITHRIAYGVKIGVYKPTNLLALTFTARAAGEMRTRLAQLGVGGVQARTFHAAALKQIAYFWPRVIGGAPPSLVKQKASLLSEVATNLGIDLDRVGLRDVASEIEWLKVMMGAADDYPKIAQLHERVIPAGLDAVAIARIMRGYEESKAKRRVIDFEDVLITLGAILMENPNILEQVQSQYRFYVVDEYQDVSPLQNYLLDLWLGNSKELCVVGDPSQTIYSFAGASANFLLDFKRKYPDAATIELVRDYRSTPEIVQVANKILTQRRSSYDYPILPLISQKPAGQSVTYEVYSSDDAEALAVGQKIRLLIESGVNPSDIAILYRTNVQGFNLEQTLTQLGIATVVSGGEKFFENPLIRKAMASIRAAARAGDPSNDVVKALGDVLSGLGWVERPGKLAGQAQKRQDLLATLMELATECRQEALALEKKFDLATFSVELDRRAANAHLPTFAAVTLASLHAAKGLEWENVFLIGLSEGLMPISLAETPAAVAEEKRLLYVGLTRAKDRLFLSWSMAKAGGIKTPRKCSRFLADLWPKSLDAKKPLGQASNVVGDYDEDLYEKLLQWRKMKGDRIGKPNFTILGENTLRHVAQVKPAKIADLRMIRGFSATKVVSYGDEVLALVKNYLNK